MGTAILIGLLNKIPEGSVPSIQYTACVRSDTSLQRLKNALGSHQDRVSCVVGNFSHAASQADTVLLGVPPTELNSLLDLEGMKEALRGKTTISLLAGTSCASISSALTGSDKSQDTYHILRVIPSIGAKISTSVTLVAQTSYAGEQQQKACDWIFNQIGSTTYLPESLMDEATAAGAAAHALAFVAIDAIADASVAEGIPRPIALQIAAQSLSSAAGLLASEMTAESLKEAMSIPKSITINSALALEKGGVRSGVSDAVRHAIQYARSFN